MFGIIFIGFLYFTIQQTEEGSGTSTPTTAPAATEDLDFSDMKKKKKKKSSKKLDLEAFEKELNESKVKDDAEDEGDDGEGDGFAEVDEAELGDDPFAQGADVPTGVDAGNEPWLKSDRDYTYPEVCFRLQPFSNFK